MAQAALAFDDQKLVILESDWRGLRVASIDLPSGLIVSGRVRDQAHFSRLLIETLSQAKPGPIRSREFVIGLPDSEAYLKLADLPKSVKVNELARSLEYQWQGLIPISPYQAYFDFIPLAPLPPTLASPESHQPILISAYPKEIVNLLMSTLALAGLRARRLVPTSFGLAELFSQKETGTIVITENSPGNFSLFCVAEQATEFSTDLRQPESPSAVVRRINNLRQYYEEKIVQGRRQISRLVVLPSQNLTTLVNQAGLAIPVVMAKVSPTLTNLNLDSFTLLRAVSLLGLLRSRFPLSILPAEQIEGREWARTASVMRTLSLLVLVLVLVLSVGAGRLRQALISFDQGAVTAATTVTGQAPTGQSARGQSSTEQTTTGQLPASQVRTALVAQNNYIGLVNSRLWRQAELQGKSPQTLALRQWLAVLPSVLTEVGPIAQTSYQDQRLTLKLTAPAETNRFTSWQSKLQASHPDWRLELISPDSIRFSLQLNPPTTTLTQTTDRTTVGSAINTIEVQP
ncbi:MAG: hypothetical protein CEO22_573 [Candidatus Berkelbacteria bacterium Gr01-1014_85]|uniref:Type IV pilus assembly protein PilM n=1 Tax=Candidatus Berkelbacteria bacterium Gr01-1014_85 TaxID=2017150 RepID=A0A554JA10_9BACT|nr:MAG: hypothetical protein CEO22_573 [Candidatus Berkelbacteria bacterium Gr01-1014_85]